MAVLRVDISELPPEVAQKIDAGEEVVIEQEGRVIAVVAPSARRASARKRGPGAHPLWEALVKLAPLDPEFERDVARLAETVSAQAYLRWE